MIANTQTDRTPLAACSDRPGPGPVKYLLWIAIATSAAAAVLVVWGFARDVLHVSQFRLLMLGAPLSAGIGAAALACAIAAARSDCWLRRLTAAAIGGTAVGCLATVVIARLHPPVHVVVADLVDLHPAVTNQFGPGARVELFDPAGHVERMEVIGISDERHTEALGLLERRLPIGANLPIAFRPPEPAGIADELLQQLRADNPNATIQSCKVTPNRADWQLHEIEIRSNGALDLTAALRIVRGIKRLTIVDPLWTDLASLRYLGIAELDISRTGVVDLEPLRWLALTKLQLRLPKSPWLYTSSDVLVELSWLEVNGDNAWNFYGDFKSTHDTRPREVMPLPRVVQTEPLPPPRVVGP